jgi:VWFA-related protein
VKIRYGIYAPPPAAFSIESSLVELAVTVKERGHAIGGFSISDFEVSDNRKPQQLKFFSEQRAHPQTIVGSPPGASGEPAAIPAPHRTIALFFDDAHIQSFGLQKARLAAEKLIGDGLQPGDLAGIFTGSGAVTVDFTADKKLLTEGLARLRPREDHGARGMGACPTLTPYQSYAIAHRIDPVAEEIAVAQSLPCMCPDGDPECVKGVPDHVRTAAGTIWDILRYQSANTLESLKLVVRHLAAAAQNRVLILISPGFVTGGMDQQTSALMDAVLRGHIVINSLDAAGLVDAGADPEAARRKPVVSELMATASVASGGRFITNNNDLSGALGTLAALPDVFYWLGFAPSAPPDDRYHALRVRLKNRSDCQIDTRPGYFAARPVAATETAQMRIDRAVQSRDRLEQIPAAVQVSVGNRTNGRFLISVLVNIDANHLPFPRNADRYLQQLTFVSVLEDSAGNYVAGKQAVMDLLLSAPTLASFKSKGLRATLSFTVPAGSYRLREVIREAVQDHLAASNTPVIIQ